MIILAIDTSCDETSAAVTSGTTVLSNIVWSQSALHADFGGVMPSLAQRMHKERIDFVVDKAISNSGVPKNKIGAIAVTTGPGLAIALGVGITKAKEIASELNIPLIPVNHIEGHLLSPLACPNTTPFPPPNLGGGIKEGGINFPAFGLVVSGGHTELVLIEHIGKYKILAQTQDDALGEALDKAARMLGLGYPGGAILEKMAKEGNSRTYPLPLPMARQQNRHEFSYSGLKTAFYRLTEKVMVNSNRQIVCDLAASFQNRAFQHLVRVVNNSLLHLPLNFSSEARGFAVRGRILLVGGGVIANVELRNRLRKMSRELGLTVRFPYSKKLIGDNAAMIGVAASLRLENSENRRQAVEIVDRRARWSVEEV